MSQIWNNLGLVITAGAIILSFVLDILIVRGLQRARERRAEQNLPPMTPRDLWPSLKLWLRHPHPLLTAGLEIGALVCLSLLYTYPLLDLRPGYMLRGNETPILTGIAMPIVEAVRNGDTFPFWNPYVQYGKSLMADPFLFIFNPFISVPMLLLGVNNGAKVAAAMSFAIAGIGMWALMKVLNARGPIRLWCGATYMLAGGMPAHLWVGHFQLAVGLAWVPWCFAGVFYALKKRTRWSIFLAVFPIVLQFMTGNLYVPLFVLIGLIVLFFVYIIPQRNQRAPWAPWAWDRARIFVLIGLFALGLTAVQFLPEWVARSHIHKGADPDFPGSQTVPHLLTNYLISEPGFYRQASLGNLPYIQEYYNYVGLAPFLFLIFLIPAVRRRPRVVLAFVAYFLFLLAWGAVKFSFVRHIFSLIPFLYQFRFPARALRIGAFALIVLSGLGLQAIWLRCPKPSLRLTWPRSHRTLRRLEQGARILIILGLIFFLGYSVRHLYQTNQPLLGLSPLSPEMDDSLQWLASYDSSQYAIDIWYHAGPYAHYEYHLRSLNATLGWSIAPPTDRLAPDLIQAHPKYVILPDDMPVKDYGYTVSRRGDDTLQLLRKNKQLAIWRTPSALPFAFTIPYQQLKDGRAPTRTSGSVIEQSAVRPTPNEIQVAVSGARGDDVLVVLESWFPGWSVTVDDQPQPLVAIDRFLGVRLAAGSHIVRFRYVPAGLVTGLLISIGTVCTLMAFMLSVDQRLLRYFRSRKPARE